MSLPKAVPASKQSRPFMLIVPYVYAVALTLLVMWQLLSESFIDDAPFAFGDAPGWMMVIAAAEVFALPFLLRLSLSPLARACSAALALFAPCALLVGLLLRTVVAQSIDGLVIYIAGSIGLIILAIASYFILNGPQVVAVGHRPAPKTKR